MNQLTKVLIKFNDKHIIGRCMKVAERDLQAIIELSESLGSTFEPASELDHSTVEDATNKHFDSLMGNPTQELDDLINRVKLEAI